LTEGSKRKGTLSLFGNMMSFSLENNKFPLLTCRKIFFRGIFEELMWFIRGQTDVRILQEKKIRIWDENALRGIDGVPKEHDIDGVPKEHDIDGVPKEHDVKGNYDLGAIYGFQWRHFGAEYKTCGDDYTDKGVDQLKNVINNIIKDPYSRRHIISAWNPAQLDKMALPPCHVMCQFYVSDEDGKPTYLSCLMTQRSCDMALGVPFNIASYSLLTIFIAEQTKLKPKSLIYSMGDCHIYDNAVEQMTEICKKIPRRFPKLIIKIHASDIEKYEFDNVELEGYVPHESVKILLVT
jgi:thymidylate synthase